MPVRAKRIQYFDDRLFKAIHAAQSGELPFPEPGGGGAQGDLPLSMRAMPMTPPSNGPRGSEADMERAREAVDGQPSGQSDVGPAKTAPVVQAVIAEEQRQMEMDFAVLVPSDDLAKEVGDEQVRAAVDDLGALESAMKDGP
jgi:type IV secretion system protein VirD4